MPDPIRILFIDDEVNILRAIARVFLDEAYEVITASSGEEALEILSRHSPVQVVVSDFRMPRMNGVELLRTIRKQWPDVVRLVISGYADTAAIVSAINDGQIYRFIPKPWNDTDLRMAIAAAVEQFRRQRKEKQYAEAMMKKIEELERENSFLVHQLAELKKDIDSQQILEELPAGVIISGETSESFRCNREAKHLLRKSTEEHAGKASDSGIPDNLRTHLQNAPSSCGHTERLTISAVPVLVRSTCLERRNSERVLLTILVREDLDG